MKKRTVLKSAAALTLTVVMLLALSLPALAAGATGSITINPNGQEGKGDGDRFTAYQVFAGEVNGDQLVNLTWGNGVEGAVLVAAMKNSHLSLGGDGEFATVFTSAWNDWSSNYSAEMDEAEFVAQWLGQHTSYADAFARIVAQYIVTQNKQEDGTKSTFDDSDWEITGLQPGYYLVIDNYSNGTERPDGSVSSYILQVVGTVEVDLKATIPTVEKKIVSGSELVDGILTETETNVTYQLTGTVAENIGEYENYSYTFTDNISKGLTVDEDDLSSLTVKYQNTSYIPNSALFTEDEDYTAELKNGVNGAHTLTVTFSDLKKSLLEKAIGTDLSNTTLVESIRIVVTYTAHLNENAVIGTAGNPNDVVLKYSNNPYTTGTGESVPDEVYTSTLALKVVKQEVGEKPLQGVKFMLMKGQEADPNAADNQFATFTEVTGTETYQEIKSWETGISNGDVLTTDAQGVFNIHGLSDGTYTLVETNAPAGYETMKPIVFTIAGNVDPVTGKLTSATLSPVDTAREDVEFTGDGLLAANAQLTLTNFKSPILPHTGGIGARIVYFVSALAVLTGAVIVFMAVRKRGRGRHEQSR